MADVIISEKNGASSVSKRNFIRVDMTPMVDLGFLLITFFMFTTNFTKPNVMDLGLPAKSDVPTKNDIHYKNQLTLILGKDNRIFYYQKDVRDLQASDILEAKTDGLAVAKLIDRYKKKAIDPAKFTLIIKPTQDANYKNFVDMLDNIALTKNERYGITDLKPIEEQLYTSLIK